MRLAVPNTCRRSSRSRASFVAGYARLGRFEDAPFGLVLLAGYALGVDPQQDVDAVSGPVGDLRWCDAGVEPGGDGCVAQVVGAAGQQRCRFRAGEGGGAGLVEDGEVGAVGEDSAAGADEDPAAGAGPVPLEVIAQQDHQFRVDWHGPRLAGCAVLEFPALASP